MHAPDIFHHARHFFQNLTLKSIYSNRLEFMLVARSRHNLEQHKIDQSDIIWILKSLGGKNVIRKIKSICISTFTKVSQIWTFAKVAPIHYERKLSKTNKWFPKKNLYFGLFFFYLFSVFVSTMFIHNIIWLIYQ